MAAVHVSSLHARWCATVRSGIRYSLPPFKGGLNRDSGLITEVHGKSVCWLPTWTAWDEVTLLIEFSTRKIYPQMSWVKTLIETVDRTHLPPSTPASSHHSSQEQVRGCLGTKGAIGTDSLKWAGQWARVDRSPPDIQSPTGIPSNIPTLRVFSSTPL